MKCWYIRHQLTSLEASAPSAGVQRHLVGCESCSQYNQKRLALDSGLRSQRTLAPLPVHGTKNKGARNRVAWAMAGSLVATASLVLFLIVQNGPTTRSARSDEASKASTQPVLVASESLVKSKEDTVSRAVARLARLSILSEPSMLDTELEALREDGQRGLHHLLSLGQRR